MMHAEHENQERRAVEALAQTLYEKEDPAGIAWAKRARIVREPWIARARRQLETVHQPSQTGRGSRRNQKSEGD